MSNDLTLAGASPAPEPQTIELWDRAEPRSILNLVPKTIQNAFLAAAQKDPDLFQCDEKDLLAKLRERDRNPTPTDNRLRLAFWMEYDKTQADMSSGMTMGNVYAGVCTKGYFYGRYIDNVERIAWLLCPPVAYETKMLEALDFGVDRLREVLGYSPINRDGTINMKIAELQTKIIFMIDHRVRGAVPQKNLNLNITPNDAKMVSSAAVETSMAALERRLADLDARERAALNLPPKEKNEPEVLPPETDS